MLREPQCFSCKNYIKATVDFTPLCKAFPKGIPMELYSGKIIHDKPYENDNGYRYNPKDK
jgi:hypothetical protein